MKSMKTLTAMLLMGALIFTSCKKDKDEAITPANTIDGTWVGKYGTGNDAPDSYFRFTVKGDGTMKVSDDPNNPEKHSGTWKLEGDVFTGTYQAKIANLTITYSVAAKYKAAEKQLLGSWGVGANNPDDGEFYLDKQ